MAGSNKDSNLRQLFSKLGHSLEEIRVRALQNILSKLEHSLLCDADLVQEKHLLIRLLEWFNFSACPCQELVLGLLLRLSQHPSAAAILLDVGAVDFLTQLRTNLDPAHQNTVDAILNNLFHLPSVETSQHLPECIYQPCSLSDFVDNTLHRPNNQSSCVEHVVPFPPDVLLHRERSLSSPPDQNQGYFVKTSSEGGGLGSVRSEPVFRAKCFKFSTFPWVALTPTDRHVLSSTDESVRSKDLSLVMSVCEFLSDVVLQDFPSEVFLQRPNIVKSVISLLMVDNIEKSGIALKALQTLRDLTGAILSRIFSHKDPALCTPKQEFQLTGTDVSLRSPAGHSANSSESQSSFAGQGEARHRGDGQDIDNSSSPSTPASFQVSANIGLDAVEQMAFEDIYSLQLMQWTVPQFCMEILENLIPCLKVDNEIIIVHSLDLLYQLMTLLRESLLPDELWTDESLPARDLTERFHDILDIVAEVLYHHHHFHGHLSKLSATSELVRHRVAFIGTAVQVMRLLDFLVPTEQVSSAIPNEFGPALALIYQDISLSYSYPDLCEKALTFAKAIDSINPSLYSRSQSVCQSLSSTVEFLMKFEELNDETLLSLIQLASESIRGLPFHKNLRMVEACVHLASFTCKKICPNPAAVYEVRGLLLKLLSFPSEEVRLNAYCTMFDIIKDALGIDHVVEPTSSATMAAMFIVDSKILYEFCCFGMNDSKKIQEMSEKTILYLLESQLLMPTARWQQILDAVIPIMAILECCDAGSALGKCVLGILEIDQQSEAGSLPMFERFRGSLRLMFHKEDRLRSLGVDRAVSLLSQEEGSLHKLPSICDLDIRSLDDLFRVKLQRSLIKRDMSSTIFQVSDLKKVYDICVSDVVQIDVRKSAAEQLAVIMQDCSLHKAFHQISGVPKLLDMLSLGVSISHESKQWNLLTGLLPSIVKILRCLVEMDTVLRHQLAHEPRVYYSVLRCGIIYKKDELCQREVSEFFGFLLFDELSSVQNWGLGTDNQQHVSDFSLPSCIVERYALPFKVPIHHQSSPWRLAIPADSDPLRQGLLLEMMRVTWSVAWHGGNLESTIKSALSNEKEVGSKLCGLEMTVMDGTLLSASYLPYALCQCIFDIQNATSHAAVSQGILRMSSYLVTPGMNDVEKLFNSLQWMEAISKFLSLTPCSKADELLLYDVVELLQLVICCHSNIPVDVMNWLADKMLNPKAAFQALLSQSDAGLEMDLSESALMAHRQLNRSLLKFVATFVGRYPYSLSVKSSISRCVHGDLAKYILAKINRADSVQSYNLSSLELTLSCLMQITARPGWSVGSSTSDCLSLSLQLLQSLLEIVSAFHVGRGGMSMSYMGRGITRCTALCLRHLAQEMAKQLHSQDWPRNWLFTRHAMVDSVGESGLHWLFPLWSYRDPEVRAAGIGIAMALASTESGRITMTTQCHSIPGGIWAVAFGVLLDSLECSLVRQQAALLLVNLTSQSMPSGTVLQTTPDTVWQGPIVMNEVTQTSLVGLSALLILLHHTEFYDKVHTLFNSIYTHPMIHATVSSQNFSNSTRLMTLDSQLTVTTSGSATPDVNTRVLVDLGSSSQSGVSLMISNNSLIVSDRVNEVPKKCFPVNSDEKLEHCRLVSADVSMMQGTNVPTNTAHPMTGVDSFSNLSSDTNVAEWQSVVTPNLASSICLLLSNLVSLAPEDTLNCINKRGIFKSLLRILDSSLLEAYQSGLAESERNHHGHWILTFQQLLNLYCDVMHLLKACTSQDTELFHLFLEDGLVLRQLVTMLGIAYPDEPDTNSCCLSLWEMVFSLLSSALVTNGQEAFIAICPIIVKHWKIIAGRVISILQEKALQDSELWCVSLDFVALLLTEEAKLKAKAPSIRPKDIYFVTDRLDAPHNSGGHDDDDDMFSSSTGAAILCQALVKTFEVAILRPPEFYVSKVKALNALKSILAISSSAKTAALEVGLLESILEHISCLQLKISEEMMNTVKTSKKKINPVISEMVMMLELLRNFLFDNEELKLYACKSGLSSLLHSIWMWCQLDPSLMSSVLALLCSYTTNCLSACSSLAFTSSSAVHITNLPKFPAKPMHSGKSLVHCLVKLLQKEMNGGNKMILKQGFTLASILVLSSECQGILWKSNFLHEFSSLTPQKSRKTKINVLLESLWLSLFVNLSFSSEGQNMIYKIEDSIPLIVEFAINGQDNQKKSALLIIRNLCFNHANKPKLLTNDRLVPLLLHSIESDSSCLKSISCSALFALLYNSQKAKGILKNAHIMKKLQDTSNHLASEEAWADGCAKTLKDILVLLKV